MAIVSCEKRNTGDNVGRSKGDTQDFEDRQVEEWDIVVSEPGYSSTRVLNEASLPAAYSPHPDNPRLRCTGEYSVRRVEGSVIHFQATVTYETPSRGSATPTPEGQNGQSETNPNPTGPPDQFQYPPGSPLPEPVSLNDKQPESRSREPYSEEWTTVESQEPIDIDINGDPIATILGEQFDPPVTDSIFDIQVTFGKNVDNKNDALIAARGHVNAGVFLGFGRQQCLIKSVNYSYRSDPGNNNPYWRQTVTILAREVPAINAGRNPAIGPDLWKKRIRAEGYLIKAEGSDDPQAAKDGQGNQSPVPVLHDKKTGEKIDDPKQAQWYFFETRPKVEFGPLNIQ
jgi:hypothetical protein